VGRYARDGQLGKKWSEFESYRRSTGGSKLRRRLRLACFTPEIPGIDDTETSLFEAASADGIVHCL
jgi:hypothetical protein